MASILDGLGLEGSVLDGLDDWPRSATRKEWFRITRELVASTIADMDLDPDGRGWTSDEAEEHWRRGGRHPPARPHD